MYTGKSYQSKSHTEVGEEFPCMCMQMNFRLIFDNETPKIYFQVQITQMRWLSTTKAENLGPSRPH